jgi:hypothetical protein
MEEILDPSILSRQFMEEIRCALEEAREEPDRKLKTLQLPEEEEEGSRGDTVDEEEEEEGSRGDTVDEEDSDDEFKGFDENGDLCLPFVVSWDPPPVLVCTAGNDNLVATQIVFSIKIRYVWKLHKQHP